MRIVRIVFSFWEWQPRRCGARPQAGCTALTGTACVPQDFVELAKWEDRGYHAMRSSTEKAQRQLHKMQRQAGDVLRQPAAAVLAEAAKSVGLSNLAAPEQLPGAAPKKGRTVPLPSATEPLVSRACVHFVPHHELL